MKNTEKVVDGPIVAARRRFGDAVHRFVDRQVIWANNTARWTPGLYTRVRGSLGGGRTTSYGHRAATSRPPVRTDVLGWLMTVDDEVARWHPGAGTIDRLKSMAVKAWRPQDASMLEDRAAQLAAWAKSAEEILHEAVTVVALRGHRCPACNAEKSYRRRDGENLRTAALMVSELGAECLACSATWTTEQLPFLATLLGCKSLTGNSLSPGTA